MAWTLRNTISADGLYASFTSVLDYFYQTFLPTYAGDVFTFHATETSPTVPADRWWWYEYNIQCMTGETDNFKVMIHYEGVQYDFESWAWNHPDAVAGGTASTPANHTLLNNDSSHARGQYKGDYLFYTGENGAFMVLGPRSSTEGFNAVVCFWPGPAGWIYQGENDPDDRFHFVPFADLAQFARTGGNGYTYSPLRECTNSNRILITDLAGFSVGKGGIAAGNDGYIPRLMWLAPQTENNYKVKWHTANTAGPGAGNPGHVVLDDGNYWLDFHKGSSGGILALVGDTPLTLPYPE